MKPTDTDEPTIGGWGTKTATDETDTISGRPPEDSAAITRTAQGRAIEASSDAPTDDRVIGPPRPDITQTVKGRALESDVPTDSLVEPPRPAGARRLASAASSGPIDPPLADDRDTVSEAPPGSKRTTQGRAVDRADDAIASGAGPAIHRTAQGRAVDAPLTGAQLGGAATMPVTPQAIAASETQGRSTDRPSLPSYKLGEMLGRGGMGEVVLADDLDIGRKVAIKRLRSDVASDALVARFYREARIQALLDHPAIVPVHEIGRDGAGRPYFTMKRLSGTTLSELIKTGKETQQRMLRAYAEVCLAIGFAHARGFIHRDLKPGNVMLGEYGETYVIDWGLARAVGETDPGMLAAGSSGSLGGETQVGAVMGTPGYMSPEQVRGDIVGPPTDVYALGAILFEILTRQNLHPSGDAAIQSTLAGGKLSPSSNSDRAIPPELDQLCTEALDDDPARRPTARQLAERVQRYLDGDRDLERRRALAGELLVTARAALDSGDPARRGEAIKAAGRALALDPESEAAAAMVAQMMIEPPKVMPPQLAQRLEEIDIQQGSSQGKRAAVSLGAYFLFLPVVLWMGVLDWGVVAALYALVVAGMAISFSRSRWPQLPIVLGLAVNSMMLIALSRVTSPFVIVPTMVVGAGILFGMFPQLLHRPSIVIGNALVTLATPIVLEAAGVWSSTWSVASGQFVADPAAVHYQGTAAKVFLIGVTLTSVVVFPLFVRALAIAQRNGRRQLEMQAWHLQHLIPDTPTTSSSSGVAVVR